VTLLFIKHIYCGTYRYEGDSQILLLKGDERRGYLIEMGIKTTHEKIDDDRKYKYTVNFFVKELKTNKYTTSK